MTTSTLTVDQLSADQKRAFDDIASWTKGGKLFDQEHSLGGYAGTGKTSLVSLIMRETGAFDGVLTPTGKAAEVLRRKGVQANTIHSAIYRCVGVEKDEVTGEEKPLFEEKIPDLGPGSWVVIDEASMVNSRLADDIRRAGFNVLWVGDHGQLPPVGNDPGIMSRPNSVLEKIMRQRGDSPIIDLAHDVRTGTHPRDSITHPKVVIRRQGYESRVAEDAIMEGTDQIICGYNRTRHAINAETRSLLGFDDPLNVGDKIICLRNNRQANIWNGQLFEVLGLEASHIENCVNARIVALDGDNRRKRWIDIDVPTLGNRQEADYEPHPKSNRFDYGYAITCHKSQGSEWDSIAVVDSPCPKAWDINRWRYTAVTRAKDRITIYC